MSNKYKLAACICLLSILFAAAKSFAAVTARDYNIIIICIDSLRPDHLGCYGYVRDTSPNIDRFAKQALRFSSAISAGDWTVESVPSILTGTYPLTHQIKYFNSLRNPEVRTIAEELSKRGYLCDLWTNHIALNKLDIQDGFKNRYLFTLYKNNKPVFNDEILTQQIIEKLKTEYKSNRFFLYIHYDGCHVPYNPPELYKSMYLKDKYRKHPESVPISATDKADAKYEGTGEIPNAAAENNITDINYYISTYDAAIRYVDRQVGLLLDALKLSGLDKNTVLILTADHAEMLGEHNMYFSHGKTYEENIKVPLIVKFPQLSKKKVIDRQVCLVDIVPTILDFAQITIPAYVQGESLMPFIQATGSYSRKYAFPGNFTIRDGDWKLICDDDKKGLWELYDLKNDPRESKNLADLRQDKFELLEAELMKFVKSAAPLSPPRKGADLLEQERQAYRKIGYW